MTTCETLTHGTRVFLSRRHRFGTDGMLLADFCRPRRDELAADLCGGCGEGGGRFFCAGNAPKNIYIFRVNIAWRRKLPHSGNPIFKRGRTVLFWSTKRFRG